MDKGAWRATVHGAAKELDMTEQLRTKNTIPQAATPPNIFSEISSPTASLKYLLILLCFSNIYHALAPIDPLFCNIIVTILYS